MQFALPPRRSPALPYAHSSRFPRYRRKQLKTAAVFAIAVFTILYLLSHLFSSSSPSSSYPSVVAPAGTASVVIVTVIDREQLSESYIKKIVENREDYAKRHGKTLPSLP
jgi:mannan polymerase II complex MNN11 subunit